MTLPDILSIVSLALCLLMFFYFKWHIKRRTSAKGFLPEYRTEVNRLIADIDAATDRDSMLIEDRIKKLKEILDETDKRVSVYVKELEKSKTGEALYTSLGRGIRAALNTEPENQAQQRQNEKAVQLSLVRPEEILVSSAPVSTQAAHHASHKKAAPPNEPPPSKPPSKQQIRTFIDTLANEGLPPEEIASRLEISIAEVNLAMNLRRPKRSS